METEFHIVSLTGLTLKRKFVFSCTEGTMISAYRSHHFFEAAAVFGNNFTVASSRDFYSEIQNLQMQIKSKILYQRAKRVNKSHVNSCVDSLVKPGVCLYSWVTQLWGIIFITASGWHLPHCYSEL